MEVEIICQLLLATFLGALVGLEREYKGKEAGLQTYSLVALGASIFTIISFKVFNSFVDTPNINFDLLRVVQAMAIGIGFIGAGVIFRQSSGILGLTTAAGLWATAAIGIAVGAKFYFLAVLAALISLLILAGLGLLEKKFFNPH
jgi:putative Mg2+ transporter-C (MgtC) family protein